MGSRYRISQVQLLNQGDIEVDFRLVHREGKFAPRCAVDLLKRLPNGPFRLGDRDVDLPRSC